MTDITIMNLAMRLCDEAVRAVTRLKFYENCQDRNGRLQWEDFKEMVDKVMYNIVVCLLSSNCIVTVTTGTLGIVSLTSFLRNRFPDVRETIPVG